MHAVYVDKHILGSKDIKICSQAKCSMSPLWYSKTKAFVFSDKEGTLLC